MSIINPVRPKPAAELDKGVITSRLHFALIPKDRQPSDFDWMNIDMGTVRVGKIRGLIQGKSMIIHSINIFTEFERNGYARETINILKGSFERIVADRVRPAAVGFWRKMGFALEKEENYIWRKNNEYPQRKGKMYQGGIH